MSITTDMPAPQVPRNLSVQCPFCHAGVAEPCTTKAGSPRTTHVARWDLVFNLTRSRVSVVAIREDQPRLGLRAGEQYFARPYWLDPSKVTLLGQVGDLHNPECNQNTQEVLWLRWATGDEEAALPVSGAAA